MDRQDIDALLIGALYGELTPADEARLAAHLESHPADRGALDDLKTARSAVRESRIFDVQVDPPQAISALLLQEAHRRAPKRVVRADEKEGWFARFTRAFLAHPAMAAAAMLVLVVGVAGTLYLKKGDQLAEKEVATQHALDRAAPAAGSAAAVENEKAPEEAPSTPPDAPEPAAAADKGGEGYNVGLAEKDATSRGGKQTDRKREEPAPPKAKVAEKPQQTQPQKKAAVRGIAVETKQPQPKELAKGDAEAQLGYESNDIAAAKSATTGAGGAAAPGGAAAGPAPRAAAQPPPPAATPASPPADPSLIAWAKQTLEQAATLAQQGGKCDRAAQLVQQIAERAPAFYSANVASDRRLKGCQSYITKLRDQQAEEKNKSRASKRVNADEYSPVQSK